MRPLQPRLHQRALADAVGPGTASGEPSSARSAEPSRSALARGPGAARPGPALARPALPARRCTSACSTTRPRVPPAASSNVVVLGIGGSALGTIAAACGAQQPLPRLRRAGRAAAAVRARQRRPRPDRRVPRRVRPGRDALFNVISKSGGTAETMAQFLIFRQRLIERVGEAAASRAPGRDHGRARACCAQIVEREGYRSFDVPEGVGGRYSVLIARRPAAAGAGRRSTSRALLTGAAAMDERCRDAVAAVEPGAAVRRPAVILHATRKHMPMAVTFAYSQRLRDLADWYAQLLAESLGKRRSRGGRGSLHRPDPAARAGRDRPAQPGAALRRGPVRQVVHAARRRAARPHGRDPGRLRGPARASTTWAAARSRSSSTPSARARASR